MSFICTHCGRPTCIDYYSGEGGMGEGLRRAGFCVSAVDNSDARLSLYPTDCPGAKVTNADAIAHILDQGHEYAHRHASPPCTGYTQATAAIADRVTRYDRLIGATREALLMVGGSYTIENVTSRLTRAELIDPLMLCWTEFYEPGSVQDSDGTPLWMRRHRLFESNLPLMGAGGCNHPPRKRGAPGWVQCAGAYGGARRNAEEARTVRHGGYVPKSVDVMGRLLGIDWMSETGCRLSIPPVYAEHIGRQVIEQLMEVAA